MLQTMSRHGGILALFAFFCTFLVTLTYQLTKNQIAEQATLERLQQINQVMPPELHDNNLLASCIQVTAPEYLGSHAPQAVFIAQKQEKITGYAIETIAPNGYSGEIKLIVGVDTNGNILGVRALSHQETPGLGDKIEQRKTPWVLSFNGKSLANTSATAWQVKKDGGEFDAFTGATITPRAVVASVFNTLRLLKEKPELLNADMQTTCEIN